MPVRSASGCCRITAALGFAVRSRCRSSNASTPADRLPRMLSRYARVVSIARRDSSFFALRFGELRRHRVERLGQHAELVARHDRLPAREVALRDRARAFREQAERRAKRSDSTTARPSAEVSASSSVSVSVSAYSRFSAARENDDLLVVAHAGLHAFSTSCASAVRHRLDRPAAACSGSSWSLAVHRHDDAQASSRRRRACVDLRRTAAAGARGAAPRRAAAPAWRVDCPMPRDRQHARRSARTAPPRTRRSARRRASARSRGCAGAVGERIADRRALFDRVLEQVVERVAAERRGRLRARDRRARRTSSR